MTKPRVLVIIPAYNEEKSVGKVIAGLRRFCPEYALSTMWWSSTMVPGITRRQWPEQLELRSSTCPLILALVALCKPVIYMRTATVTTLPFRWMPMGNTNRQNSPKLWRRSWQGRGI